MHNRKTTKLACVLVLMLILVVSAGALANGKGNVVPESHPLKDIHAKAPKSYDTCAACHTCEHPTRQDPCLESCPRYEGHFSSEKKADAGPDIVIIDQLADLYGPVIFGHKLHAEMSNMTGGCENCHHYSEQSGTIPPCYECHGTDMPNATLGQPSLKGAYHRQCINCHLDWSGENACGFCHNQVEGTVASVDPDSTDIIGLPHAMIAATETYVYETSCDEGPLVTFHHQDHVELFGQQCVDCHRGDTCGKCHDTIHDEPARLDHVNSCFICHGEKDCAFCHSEETLPRFDHGISTGLKLDPYHTDVACATCHGDPKTFKHPKAKCTQCHIHWEVGSFNHAVTGLTLDENHIEEDCGSCHLEMNFSVAPSCEDCHDEPMFPKQLPGKRSRR